MTGTNCDLFTHNQSRSYLNHLVLPSVLCLLADVSEHPAGSILWVEVIVQSDHFDPEDRTDKMFRNVGQKT